MESPSTSVKPLPAAEPAAPAGVRSAAGNTPYRLQCMELIGGNQAIHQTIRSPGLDTWLYCQPMEGRLGGDLHFFSMCGSGRVTRIAVADISGHGPAMDAIARWLRKRMRKYINLLDQTTFARAVNREFTRYADADFFATFLLTTYFAPTDHLIVCNGGHPRPIWYSTRTAAWRPLDPNTPDTGPSIRQARGTYLLKPVANLPLGVIEPTTFQQFTVKLEPGDVVLLYTDGLIETRSPEGVPLEESGLLGILRGLADAPPAQLGPALFERIDAYAAGAPPRDDRTLIVMHHTATDPPTLTVGQALRSLARMVGLIRI